MQQKKIDVWVGLFVLLGVAAIVGLVLKVGGKGGLPAGDTYQLRANVSEIGNLKVRSPVKLAGVTIGRVDKIALNPVDNVYKAELTISLSKAVQLPKDTSLAIDTSGLIGEQYVHLTQGFDKEVLAANDEIVNTQEAMGLEGLVRTFINSKTEPQAEGDAAASDPKPVKTPAAAKPKTP